MWYAKEYEPIKVGSIDGTDTTSHDAAIQRATLSERNMTLSFCFVRVLYL
jgi:hypothetical protein